MRYYRTSESVTEGHPDKVCDLIADSILDACLTCDPHAHVACEVMATAGKVVVAGEITCVEPVPIEAIVRSTLHDVGYDPSRFEVEVYISEQSPDIAAGVAQEDGAGDQGIMYGYAVDETESLLPLPVVLSNRLAKRLTLARKAHEIEGLLPDGKTQVTVAYDDDRAYVDTIVVSAQHTADKSQKQLASEIIEKVIMPTIDDTLITPDTKILINPSGRFVIGGPEADTGLTGRKIMVDTYGGLASHGGGAFSGKDATKVDRSGAYMARYIAKQFVAAGVCNQCEVSISYAIGKAEPVAFFVSSLGTSDIKDDVLTEIALHLFDLRPAAIIRKLDLRQPIFVDTAAYGHFGKPWLAWEQTDMADAVRTEVQAHAD